MSRLFNKKKENNKENRPNHPETTIEGEWLAMTNEIVDLRKKIHKLEQQTKKTDSYAIKERNNELIQDLKDDVENLQDQLKKIRKHLPTSKPTNT